MADSGGHWKTLAEAQKLTQSTKIPGVFEEDIKRVNPLDRIAVAQAAETGNKIEWLREATVIEDDVVEAEVGSQLNWSEDVEYTEVESQLRISYIQRKLDHFVKGIYGTYNNYQVQVLLEMEKAIKRKIGDRIIYGDTTYGGSPTQFDGLHALAAERGTPSTSSTWNTYSKKNMDMATGALSLLYLRTMLDDMRYGVDEILTPSQIGIRFDALYEERGITFAVSSNGRNQLSLLTRGFNDIGRPIMYFAGVPITRTDFLVAEQDGTGTGGTTNKRSKYSSGTATYSLFMVKYGDVMARQPGICYGYGLNEGVGDFYKLRVWSDLEDYDAGGMRMVNYGAVLQGSTQTLGRIFDITDAAIVE
jgi:hypothetical protein